ncbi:hypothetical protein NCER_100529 [Vairimorpha ceranae BRL01]|uniref:Uncharacterized protein n=2 Tax=Vairimorpha ceranae TaxID=40302 RepID=C4V7T8_VAIC1|nr:hypothetical protein AAJ76_710009063 [Vairimorpha ceranae]EEQ82712.1 hypothetical protein NCER_100529 [Vairimorpha ceranae BRL01]KKO74444.1 hypothetical protein AAJ76_710009063 [Vairimorpha ceranae]
MIVLFIIFICSTKVYISPFSDDSKALSFTKLNSGNNVFDFQSVKRKDMTGLYCLSPIIVPISLVDYRIYFCGELMCFNNNVLTVCENPNKKSLFKLQKSKEYFMIVKDGMCLHYFKGNIFLRECDDEFAEKQLFKITPVQIPFSDNQDIDYEKRNSLGGIREIEFDQAMRSFSQIHHSEFIEEVLFFNDKRGNILRNT